MGHWSTPTPPTWSKAKVCGAPQARWTFRKQKFYHLTAKRETTLEHLQSKLAGFLKAAWFGTEKGLCCLTYQHSLDSFINSKHQVIYVIKDGSGSILNCSAGERIFSPFPRHLNPLWCLWWRLGKILPLWILRSRFCNWSYSESLPSSTAGRQIHMHTFVPCLSHWKKGYGTPQNKWTFRRHVDVCYELEKLF